MKNNYGKLTKKKAIELLYKYNNLEIYTHKILDVAIFKSEKETDCAEILIKLHGDVVKYFISCFGILETTLKEDESNVITTENVFLKSEEKTHE